LKNNIKRLSAVALVIIVMLTLCGFSNAYNPKAYNVDNILETITKITSEEFNGRSAGTPGGKKTEEYFAAKFKEIGLKPGGDNNTYFQTFTGVKGDTVGPYILEVVDRNKVIKAYKYGTDFKLLARYPCSGEVTASGKVVEEASGNMPKASGEIALLKNYVNPNIKNPQPLIDVYNAGYSGIIFQEGDTIDRKKGHTGYYGSSDIPDFPRVSVSKPVFDELINYSDKGYKIHLAANYVVSDYSANNVIGVLEAAKPTDECLIISAHMDHVSPDPDGVYFPGALDNASGASSMLEIARALKSQYIKPDINIVFIAFNGEEIWHDGARYYVTSPLYPLEKTTNLNLDAIGAKKEMPLYIAVSSYSKEDENTNKLTEEIKTIGKKLKYDIALLDDDSADHSEFAQAGVPSVTLIDAEVDVYHVPEDTIDNIGVDNLIRGVEVAMHVIGDIAYMNGAITPIPTASKVLINGKSISFDAYNINGNNYFKLRDLAMALNGTKKQFEVGYDGTKDAINLTTNKANTPVGGELAASTKPKAKEAKPTTSKVFVNGMEVKFTAVNIGGNNYFKLRDVAKVIDFGVGYDGKKDTIIIDTSTTYTE